MGLMRILVVEPDPQMLEPLRKALEECGHTVTAAGDSDTGLAIAMAHEFDAIVCGITQSEAGLSHLVESLRHGPGRPAIVSLSSAQPKGTATAAGAADESFQAPFSFAEMPDRIGAAVRRVRARETGQFSLGPLHLDLSRRRLYQDQSEVPLTRNEYLLLRMLALRRGETVPRRQLLQAVWGTTVTSHGALDALVEGLRGKLEAASPGLIADMEDGGYTLLEEPPAQPKAARGASIPSNKTTS
jgi:two-component system copper resistance phosphate regulon response regulator CusR